MHNKFSLNFWAYTFVYCLAFLPLVIVPGHFWDDWVWFETRDRIHSLWELGRPYMIFWIAPFDNLISPISFPRILTFISYFLSGIYLQKVLVSIKELDFNKNLAWMAATVSTLAPLNFARVTNSINHYVFSYLAFVIAVYLLVKFLKNNSKPYITLSILFFCFSFTTNSFLIIYIIVPFIIFATSKTKNLFDLVKNYYYLLLLPIGFYLLNKFLFPPHGAYENYNLITLEGLSAGIKKTPLILYNNLLDSIDITNIFTSKFKYFFTLSFIVCIFSWMLKTKNYSIELSTSKVIHRFLLFLVFLILSFLSLYPYVVVGHTPSSLDWISRDQLVLQLFVGPLFLTLALLILNQKHLLVVASSFIVSVFVVKNHIVYTNYIKDAHSQNSIILNLKENKTIKNNNFFILDDSLKPYQTMARYLRSYEINFLFKHAFGDQTRYALTRTFVWDSFKKINHHGISAEDNSKLDLSASLGFKYTPGQDIYRIFIKAGNKNISYIEAYTLSYLKIFDPNKYKEKIKHIVKIETEKVTDLNQD